MWNRIFFPNVEYWKKKISNFFFQYFQSIQPNFVIIESIKTPYLISLRIMDHILRLHRNFFNNRRKIGRTVQLDIGKGVSVRIHDSLDSDDWRGVVDHVEWEYGRHLLLIRQFRSETVRFEGFRRVVVLADAQDGSAKRVDKHN